LAELIGGLVYSDAVLTFGAAKPDGMARKLPDVTRWHALPWRHCTDLSNGIAGMYEWFLKHEDMRISRAPPSGPGREAQSTGGYRRKRANCSAVRPTNNGL
jgi:hypothetical protein